MKILIASDHAGFEMKNALEAFLKTKDFDVVDYGAHEINPEDDYPDFVAPLASEISENSDLETRGIVIGGSGQGEAICANRFPGVRAVVFNGPSAEHLTSAEAGRRQDEIVLSRQHNDANVLSLGARFLSVEEAKEAVLKWLTTSFSNEARHERRIEKIESLAPSTVKNV